ncbi:hypothetical protein D3C76_1816480 [compost metagenome]
MENIAHLFSGFFAGLTWRAPAEHAPIITLLFTLKMVVPRRLSTVIVHPGSLIESKTRPLSKRHVERPLESIFTPDQA